MLKLEQWNTLSIKIHSNFSTTDYDDMYLYLLLHKDHILCEAENAIYHNWLSSQFTVVVHAYSVN